MSHGEREKTMPHAFRLPQPAFALDWAKSNDFYFNQEEIEELRGARVLVKGRGEMIMLGSFSYLGLLNHPRINAATVEAIARYGTGTHGSRLLTGTTPVHIELEAALARIKRTDAACVFSSGYVTNLSVISALVGRHDIVFSDRLNHASIVDSCQFSGAEVQRFRHNDMDDLRRQLAAAPQERNKLVVVDAVFSMDGDIIDLRSVSKLCREYGALLMVDEAHSFGVLGDTGAGIEEHFGIPPDTIDIKMGTLSKAIPSVGGYIAASRAIIDMIKHRGRAFIYSGALPPVCAAAALEAIAVIRDEPWRVKRLQANARQFLDGLHARGINTLQSSTAIVPVVVGENERAHRCARHCQRAGLFVHCIPSPVVPKGTERLRCIMTTDHSAEDIEHCQEVIRESMRATGPMP